ncbi:MAG: hypothetical protein ACPG40_03620 [Alphaproteobacteria bacterium]
MKSPAKRPSLLAPILTLVVAVGTLAWGVKSTSAWTMQQAIFGVLDANSSADVRALVAIFAVSVLELVLAAALLLARWQPGNLHILGLILVGVGVIFGQMVITGPFWALALLGAWLVWESFSMRAGDEG